VRKEMIGLLLLIPIFKGWGFVFYFCNYREDDRERLGGWGLGVIKSEPKETCLFVPMFHMGTWEPTNIEKKKTSETKPPTPNSPTFEKRNE
jgi:hypothetical protein